MLLEKFILLNVNVDSMVRFGEIQSLYLNRLHQYYHRSSLNELILNPKIGSFYLSTILKFFCMEWAFRVIVIWTKTFLLFWAILKDLLICLFIKFSCHIHYDTDSGPAYISDHQREMFTFRCSNY